MGRPFQCCDMKCNQDREHRMVRVSAATDKDVFCDPCIAPLVKALNDGGINTVASCCGHNRRPASIILDGDIWLTITNRAEAERINSLFPGDINSDFTDAPQSVAHRRAVVESNARLWSVRDALIETLREIDSGIQYDAVVICLRQKDGPRDGYQTQYWQAGAGLHDSLGLLARVSQLMGRDIP